MKPYANVMPEIKMNTIQEDTDEKFDKEIP
jgi:hypothetical protein